MIDYVIRNYIKNIDIESLKQDDVMYSVWLSGFISKIESFCDLHKINKEEVYLKIGKILYPK